MAKQLRSRAVVEEVVMNAKVLVLPGEGIGPEVIAEAVKVLEWFSSSTGLNCDIRFEQYGVSSYQKYGLLVREEVFADLPKADAVLFGATGGPEFDALPRKTRLSSNLLAIRKHMAVYANLRPITAYDELSSVTSLKVSAARGVDLILVRELNGGIYFGEPRGRTFVDGGIEVARNTLTYTTAEIERIARVAFEIARARGGYLHSVDKSNVLETYQLWRDVVVRIGADEFPDVPLHHILVDNCAMQMIRYPKQFDVILTDNMIGDILSDLAGAITGSLGMLPSASLSDFNSDGKRSCLYEPVHGSAPDIAGQGIANPLGAILCIGLMMEYSFGLPDASKVLRRAVRQVLADGIRTPDIKTKNLRPVSTEHMGDEVVRALTRITNG